MLQLPCPFCGLRDETEFAYGGDAGINYPGMDNNDEREWSKYVFIRRNPRGAHREYWHHLHGCRQWLIIKRNTETHDITASTPARPFAHNPSFPPPQSNSGNPAATGIGVLPQDDQLSPDGDYAAPAASLQTVATQQQPQAPNRLSSGGRINHHNPLRASFDGKALSAYQGDTLASALLAAGEFITARSFKYHRPRGIYSAGYEEPCALIHTHTPNAQATTAEVYDGITASGQNAFPNVRFDIGAMMEMFSPFIAAGFYYKTFIGIFRGTKWWMFCEKYIRRAAGMGRAELKPDDKEYEKTNIYCDVLIIGGGIAGLAATLAAGRSGAAVIMAEQDFSFGGMLLSQPPGGDSDKWLNATLDELRQMPNVRLLKRAMVSGSYEKNIFSIIQSAAPPVDSLRQRLLVVRAKQAILASGAIERPLVFANNDRPGVMLANAARTYLNRYAVLPGKNIIIAANNDSAHNCARDFAAAGAKVLLLDCRPSLPDAVLQSLQKAGIHIRLGSGVIKALGRRRVMGAQMAEVDNNGNAIGKITTAKCDLIAISGGWNSAVHLWSQRRGQLRYDTAQQCFIPAADNDGIMHCIYGNATTAEVAASAFSAGKIAAAKVGAKQQCPPLQQPPNANSDNPMRNISPVWRISAHKDKTPPKAFLDLQHDVTLADMDLAYREGYTAAEHAKRYTTAGMATDQGKTSAMNTAAYLAHLRGASPGEVAMPSFRPPFSPVAIGAMAGRQCGKHFRPIRRTPIHQWHLQNGAVLTDTGAWLRPWYYPQKNEDMRAAVIREVNNTRTNAGIIDIGTLGKIAVQGADAAQLLNRLYVNKWLKLQDGRLRYGVMLREDGFVLDDGATAKLANGDYFMTTTTANAARVLAFAEKMLQTRWQNLRAHVSSISDQWAAFAIAGPNARAILAKVICGFDINALLPNAATTASINNFNIRIHRLSFSGELAFEIYVPSAFALAVWQTLFAAGGEFGLHPYGTEAMGVMRIEKGHPTGAEIDGRTTLEDLGFGKMAATDKSFIGSVLRHRPALQDSRRCQLAGLIIEGKTGAPAGALVFPQHGDTGGRGEGWLSSAAYSPTLNKNIALAFIKNGNNRRGEVVRVIDFLGKNQWQATITAKCFYDPENKRQNA